MTKKLGTAVKPYCDCIDSNIIEIAYVGSVFVVVLTLILNFMF